ncbi:unnamed protein product [Strongylus vulgaris]|uniref:Uncharacterized protein n=1 Tax=Strongylus vulgaris TaxID=40348 RepID=A0A3P7J780_STRVU|nr:unnamed protein product [Strongylus vulgaris]
MKWRTLTGALCDKRMPVQLKSQIYHTVIRPTALYGSECWSGTRNEEHKLSIMETRMLRWTLGMKVVLMVKKMQEKQLRWYGHVGRRDESHVTGMAMSLEVAGIRPRGRPKMRWMDRLELT